MPDDAEQPAVLGPCGACRTLRRRCAPGCVFAPYFSASDFAAVHAVFGASNASKMLERVSLPEQRAVAAATLVAEARARAADPTFGRVAYLRILQEVNDKARKQVDEARAEIAREFGSLAAGLPVDVAAVGAEVRVEARRQVDAALQHARQQDARLLGVRNANEARWRELHPEEGTGIDAKRRREPTTLMPRAAKQPRGPRPPGFRFPDERENQQMAAAEDEKKKALLMRQAAPATQQHGHHLAAQHGETGPARVPEVCGNGQLHQQMSEASREEVMMRSVHTPAAAPHAGDAAAGRTPGQGTTSVLLEAMMQLAGAGDEKQQQQQHLVPQHADKEYDIAQGMMQLQELFDMAEAAELAREQQIMKDDAMAEVGQWDAAAGSAMEQDVTTTMMQQIPTNTWQHSDPAPQYAGMRDAPQEMPRQMEEASTAELAQTTAGNMSQQFAWAQQYHDYPAAAAHRASPWHHQTAEAAHQPAAASSASHVASEQDMLLLLQQHLVAAADELVPAGGAHQFDNNLAAEYDDTELTLGYGHHPDMHQQAVTTGQQHAQTGLDVALGHGHPNAETQALLQELGALLEHGGNEEMIRAQDVVTMMQQDPDDGWLLEKLEQIERESMAELPKRLEIMSRQAGARHAQEELGKTEMARKQEMLMRQFVAAERAREQELITQQAGVAQQQHHHHHAVAQNSEKKKLEMLMKRFVAAERAREQELITQQAAAAAQQQQLPVVQNSEKERKLETLMRQFVAAERAREQELIAQQAAAAQQQQHVAQQYSGTELDISLGQGQGQGHQYWRQPTVQQMLQEQQLADAVGFGRHQPSTTLAQPVANGEHGSGAAMAFLAPESAKDAPFLADQQPQPNGHQMGSSLLQLPPPSGQLHAQVSHQQRTDGGGQGLNSDLAAYLHYESLSRHGLADNGRFHQG